jgi:hypothetical protein
MEHILVEQRGPDLLVRTDDTKTEITLRPFIIKNYDYEMYSYLPEIWTLKNMTAEQLFLDIESSGILDDDELYWKRRKEEEKEKVRREIRNYERSSFEPSSLISRSRYSQNKRSVTRTEGDYIIFSKTSKVDRLYPGDIIYGSKNGIMKTFIVLSVGDTAMGPNTNAEIRELNQDGDAVGSVIEINVRYNSKTNYIPRECTEDYYAYGYIEWQEFPFGKINFFPKSRSQTTRRSNVDLEYVD